MIQPRASPSVPRPHWAVIFFPSTESAVSKGFTQDDTVEVGSSTADRGWITSVARALYRRTPAASDPLFSLTLRSFETRFTALAAAAGLRHVVPHQLRHGGPSVDAVHGCSAKAIQRRGRWASSRSVQRYMKQGRYLKAVAALPADFTQRFNAALRECQFQLPRKLRELPHPARP